MEPIKNRYEFTVIFDVENGNPNGDPDAGNMPRIDPETSAGLVTDVCLKRKIRNFVEIFKEDEPYYNILVKPDKALNTKFTEAYEAIGEKTGQKGKNPEAVRAARDYICQNYFDVAVSVVPVLMRSFSFGRLRISKSDGLPISTCACAQVS